MKKWTVLLLSALLAWSGAGMQLHAAESASPYDSVVEISKNSNSAVDALISGVKDVNSAVRGRLAEILKNSSIWKTLSEESRQYIGTNIGKLGPLVKKLGWIANAVDLAPSVYQTVTSFAKRDKESFRKAFRDTALKTAGIVVGLGIGAAVTAATPAIVAATAATGGVALLAIAAGGAVVSVGGGMLADKAMKSWFSKSLEDYAGKLYDKLTGGNDDDLALPSVFQEPQGGGPRNSGARNKGGAVKLDKLQW